MRQIVNACRLLAILLSAACQGMVAAGDAIERQWFGEDMDATRRRS